MFNMRADLVCIQETHDTTSTDQETANYRYISTGAQPIDGEINEKRGRRGGNSDKKRTAQQYYRNNAILAQMHESKTTH